MLDFSSSPVSQQLPFSIIIPTHNRQQSLRRCLDSLGRLQREGQPIEVIVVNDGGAPLDILGLQKLCPDLVVIEQVQTGPAGARNAGIAVASYPYLAFTDDDCVPDPRWVLDLQDAFATNPLAMIGGHTVNLFPNNVYSEASQLVVDAVCRWHNKSIAVGGFVPSNNMACRRDQLMAMGGFNASFPLAAGEDRELCDRWHASGWPIVQCNHRAQVAHGHWLDHHGFWKQQHNYGRAACTLHRLRQSRGMPKGRAGIGFLLFLLRLAIQREGTLLRRVLLMLLAIESQLAILVGSLQQRRSEPNRFNNNLEDSSNPVMERLNASKLPSVSIVIPVYQAGDELKKALDSIGKSRRQPQAVILIDNGSTDRAVESVAGKAWELIIIRNNSNLGFGKACNQGLELAQKRRDDFALLLNQDAQLEPDTLGSMVDLATRQSKVAVVGCLTLSSNDSLQLPESVMATVLYNGSWRRWLPTWQRLPDIGAQAIKANRKPRQVDYVWGHGMLLKLNAITELNFDPGFFMYFEDLDLCWRIQKAGWEIWCDSRAVLWHHQSDPARAGRSCFQRWRMKASSSRFFYRKRHPKPIADGLWLLHQLRESFPLLWRGYLLAVFHIWQTTLLECLFPNCSSVDSVVPAPIEHGLQSPRAERSPTPD